MGPVEIVFIAVWVIFGVVGIVRGYRLELGVTTMLLIALFVLEFLSDRFSAQLNRLLTTQWQSIISSGFLVILTFVSYEGETLAFPGKGDNPAFSLLAGLLNGYLFAGSLWYYLSRANWLGLPIDMANATSLYQILDRLLPPAIFSWPYLILLAVVMLIMRVWK